MSLYITPYYAYVHGNTYVFQLMLLYSIGVLSVFFRVLEEDEEVTFLDKGTGGYWGEGWCLVPSFLPFLRNIGPTGINFPFGLRNRRRKELEERRRNVDIHHYRDQDKMEYHVNVQTTMLGANTNRFFEGFFRWFFGYEKGRFDLLFQRFGFRVMLLALVAGWFTNQTTAVGEAWDKYNPFKDEVVNATIQLDDGIPRPLPADHQFVWKKGMPSLSMPGSRETLFVPYHEIPGKTPYITVKEKLCATVPAGKILGFDTQYKPVYAVNMKNDVVYMKRYETLSPLQRLIVSISGAKDYKTSDTWTEVVRMWDTVESEKYVILAQALDQESLSDKRALGGMVCF